MLYHVKDDQCSAVECRACEFRNVKTEYLEEIKNVSARPEDNTQYTGWLGSSGWCSVVQVVVELAKSKGRGRVRSNTQ